MLHTSGSMPTQQRQTQVSTSLPTVLETSIRREMHSWSYLGAVLLASGLMYGEAQAAPNACGAPTSTSASTAGIQLWKDCATNTWTLKAIAGGSKSVLTYEGNISATQAASLVTGSMLESNDVLNTSDPKNIQFKLNATGAYYDAFNFKHPTDTDACLTIATAGTKLLVGPNGTAVTSPFNLKTLETCVTTPVKPPETSFQVVTPRALDAYTELRNPGRGIEQAGKIMNNGTFNYNKAVEADADITYIRLPWANLEPNGDNQWNWAALDAAIENAVSRGKQAAISVISWRPVLDNNNYQDAVPAWYKNSARHVKCTSVGQPANCTYYVVNSSLDCTASTIANCTNRWAFNHDDPIFIQNQVELIDAMRARYDNPQWAEKIAYMDVRSIGSWSENHATGITLAGSSSRWPMPKWTNMKAILDAHLDYQYIPQIVNFDNDDKYRQTDGTHPWDYACSEAQLGGQSIGWRTDGIEVTLWEINQVWSWSQAAKECWKSGPVYAEAMSGSGLPSANLTEGLTRLTNWHASGWNNKYSSDYPNNASYTAEVDTWLMDAGYRLQVSEARIPKVAVANTAFEVEVQLANQGNAPLYRNFYELQLKFSPVSGGSEVVVPLGGELRKVLPGEPATTFAGSGKLTAGEYRVSVGVIEDPTFGSSFPVKLAQESSSCVKESTGWWCEIATTTAK